MTDDGVSDDGGRSGVTLGQSVAGRFRRPGPPLSRPRPSPIGSLAMAATRFAAATAHSPDVRRSLRGPEPVRARSIAGQGVSPPRWWQYWWSLRGGDESASSAPAASATALPALPPRGLPRVVRTGEGGGARPGHMVGRLAGDVARVRRPPEVTSVGPMLVERERVAPSAPPNRAPTNRAPTHAAPGNRAGEVGPRPAHADHSSSAADLSANVVRRLPASAVQPTAGQPTAVQPTAGQAAAAIARSIAAAGEPAPGATGRAASPTRAADRPAATPPTASASSSVNPAAFGHAVAAAAPSPPVGRWGALRHAATPRSRAAAASAAAAGNPAASAPALRSAASAGGSATAAAGTGPVVRRSMAPATSSIAAPPAPGPAAVPEAAAGASTPSPATSVAGILPTGTPNNGIPSSRSAPGETAARTLGTAEPLMSALDGTAPAPVSPAGRGGANAGLRRATGPALTVAAATARRSLPAAPSIAAASAARATGSAEPVVVRRSPAAATARSTPATPMTTASPSSQSPASPSSPSPLPAGPSHPARPATAGRPATHERTPGSPPAHPIAQLASGSSYRPVGGLALASIGGLARTAPGGEATAAEPRGPSLLRAAGSARLDLSTAVVSPAAAPAMRSVAPTAPAAAAARTTGRTAAAATQPAAAAAVVRRFPSARPGATVTGFAPRDISVATRLPAWSGSAAARTAPSPTSTPAAPGRTPSMTTRTSGPVSTQPAPSRRSWPVMPPRSARPATTAGEPPVPATGGSSQRDESAVVRRSLVDRTSHMFEAGTKSAETPRTGAPAPSLNSMGADTRVAGQPVVRRLLDDSTAQAAQATGSSTASEVTKPDPDKVAADNGEFFERIVDALEQRVLDELERRGHRRAPGVF